MKITVPVARLAEMVKARQAAELAAYNKAVEAYPAAEARYRASVIAGLNKAVRAIEAGRRLPEPYSSWRTGHGKLEAVLVPVGAMPPAKPKRPTGADARRRLRELNAHGPDTMTVDLRSPDWAGLV